MKTPASIAGHPIHPMLVAVPIGLWLFSFVCDLVFAFLGGGDNWRMVALYTLVGGIVGALAAAIPGLIDLLSLERALRRIAVAHMSVNLTVVALYVSNAWLRLSGASETTTLVLSAVAVAALVVSGWLGGKMVYEHGVAVGERAA